MRASSKDRSSLAVRKLSRSLQTLQSDYVIASRPARFSALPALGEATTVRAARRLNRAAGMIAASVLADSAMEHYDPARSVVDADCRLWVCDGSVFPTVGGVHPALTIQIIALRRRPGSVFWPGAASCERRGRRSSA